MRIFHVATSDDWDDARRRGSYRTSTYRRSLDQEGFIHACRPEQLSAVLDRWYADAPEQLVVLEIETDLLDMPWREEPVGEETFPHLYGPLPARAVVGWRAVRDA